MLFTYFKTLESFQKRHSNISFDGFVEFVKTRPADREIRHSAGWENCAVGNYIARCHRRGRNTQEHRDAVAGFVAHILPQDIRKVLDMPSLIYKFVGPNMTYGELADYLTEQGY